ncbi:MAG: sterol desaturase family protein [Thermoleophilaceae bacterium]|nr:sterol desaturase family protein [Thermoleophilaceae bacterium]
MQTQVRPPAPELENLSRAELLRASPPMFESKLLDKLSRVHPSVPVIIFLPAIVALLVLAAREMAAWPVVGFVLLGYAIWSLSEYWIHRVIFHFEPEEGFGARLHWIIHGVHHDHPNDPLRLVMPPAVSVPLAAGFFFAFWGIFGLPHAYAVGCGFFAGYLAYDMTHYHLHHHTSKTRLGRLLRELHMRHHFQDDTRGYGISAPYWDKVFGTWLDRRRRAERAAE